MSNRMRYGKRFSNTGLGQQPTAKELFSLSYGARKTQSHFAEVAKELKERAEAGDLTARYRLTKMFLAKHSGRSKKKPTKVQFSFLKDDE